MCEFVYFSCTSVYVFGCFFSSMEYFSVESECYSFREYESNTTWEHPLKLESIMFFCFQSNIKLYEECSRGLSYSDALMCKVDPWTLCLFAVFCFPSCARSAAQLFVQGLGHRYPVCCGAPNRCCAYGLFCAEKQRWQVCRYAVAAQATRNALHGKRSVSLWPGLGPLAVSPQDVNQNSTHEM